MTDKPTDEALENLFVEETGFDIDDFPAAIFGFARTVLAKWGQPAQAAESRTIPDREIAGIVERALQELEGLVKYVTSTYCHWDMRRAKGALSDLEWWARRNLAAHAQAAEPVAREPLTPERVKEIVRGAGYDQCGIPDTERAAFINGLRHGEQAHGIKKGGQHGTE